MNANFFTRLFGVLPFLAYRGLPARPMSLRSHVFRTVRTYAAAIYAALFLCLALRSTGQAYTVVTISTGAPAGLERDFIASATAQWSADFTVNPLFGNTYALTLYGPNPAFNAPPTTASLLYDAVAISTQTYLYGFADGMTYQQTLQENVVAGYGELCDGASNFMLNQTSTSTFDLRTCEDTINTILNALFEMSLSTPTAIPGQP